MTSCFFPDALFILQVSDCHILAQSGDKLLGLDTEYYFRAVLEQAHQQYPKGFDYILASGDLAQDPTPSSYQRVYQALANYQTPTVCLAGNHDDWSMMQQCLNQGEVSCQRQILWKHWQLICLNSQKINDPGGYLPEEELQFLAQCLSEQPQRHALIAMHHHCTPSYSEWLDTMQITNHAELFNCLNKYSQIKVITTGHIHQQLDTEYADIRILGVPSTCFQFKPLSAHFALDNIAPGYRVLMLYPDGHIDTQIHRLPEIMSNLQLNSKGY